MNKMYINKYMYKTYKNDDNDDEERTWNVSKEKKMSHQSLFRQFFAYNSDSRRIDGFCEEGWEYCILLLPLSNDWKKTDGNDE